MLRSSGERVIAELPFRETQCDAIVAMPISFNFMGEAIGCIRTALGIRTFDLLGIPGFSKRFSRESKVVLDTINISVSKHSARHIVIFQHVDFHASGKSTRFKDRIEEDYRHKRGLIDSYEKLINLYPGVKVTLIYARLVKDQCEIEFSKIFKDGGEEVCLRAPYLFRGMNECKTTVIQCLDFRFRPATRACIQDAFGISNFNVIGLPGSSKVFLEDSRTAWKGIKVAYEQHSCRSFIVVHHEDCLAYGGTSNFINAAVEEDFHRVQLIEMKKRMIGGYPDIEVALIYTRLIDNRSKMQFVLVG